MKKIILFVLINLMSINIFAYETDLPFAKDIDIKEGDIVFQISKSKQAPFIQWATWSLWTHCGIIVYKNKQPYVLEASNVVKLTDLTTWINRGRNFTWASTRILDNCPKISYKKYLGMPYDKAFKFNNGRMYCSELVYIIYKEQLGIKLCKPRKISSYNLLFLKGIMKRRHINMNQYVVAPSDIYNEAKKSIQSR